MLQTDLAHIHIDLFGICRITLDSSKHKMMGPKEAEEICEAIVKVCQGRPTKLLTDARDVDGHVGQKAREIIRNHPGMLQVRLAEAFVVNGLGTRLIVNFYMKFNKPPNPTRLFTSIEEAEQWLSSIEVERKTA